MYQLFGMEVVDSKEIKEQIETNTVIIIFEDITKGTQREDAIGYRGKIQISHLGYENNTEFNSEEEMDELMKKADEYATKILKNLLPKTMDLVCFSYTYDPVEQEVLMVIPIMHISNAERKLRDVLKRLLRI